MEELSVQAKTLHNPYWDNYQETLHKFDGDYMKTSLIWQDRKELVRQFSFAIPSPEALEFVAAYMGPRGVEMGAGTGYWCSLLSQLGIDMVAYDIAPPMLVPNKYHAPYDQNDEMIKETIPCFFDVSFGEPEILKQHGDRTLFLCWPPYESDMAYQSLMSYPGSRLIYIGEGDGGCTGDDAFHAEFYEHTGNWEQVATFALPHWDGMHDIVYVYDRKEGKKNNGWQGSQCLDRE